MNHPAAVRTLFASVASVLLSVVLVQQTVTASARSGVATVIVS